MSEDERRRLGRQLTARRKAKGWTLKDVAVRTGRQPSRISEMETGRANSTIDALEQVAEVAGLRLMLVPVELSAEITAILERTSPSAPPAAAARTVFDEVFIPDPEDDDADDR